MAEKEICISDFALDFGAAFLESGAEIYRAEDTLVRILSAGGVEDPEAFAITSLLSVNGVLSGKAFSQTKRIGAVSYDLDQVDLMNTLSREFCSGAVSLAEAYQKLAELKEKKKAASRIGIKYLIGAFIASGAFSVFFGGSVIDGIIAGLIGVLMAVFIKISGKLLNSFALNLIVSFLAGALSILIYRVGFPIDLDKIIIGEIMIVIPGLSLGTSLRELFEGDTISGSLRLIQALLTAIMIACGFALSFILFGGEL